MQPCRSISNNIKHITSKTSPTQTGTMVFFPRSFYNNAEAASFTPLFRLLDDFDSYSRQASKQTSSASRKPCLPSFQPKFDVRETANAYELHGELPGVAKENVHIEFNDPQTLTVHGTAERSYNSNEPEAAAEPEAVEPAPEAPADDRASHQASVADEDDAEAQENGWQEVAAKEPEQQPEAAPAPQKPADTAKYWLTERSIGEFARSFNFPTRVEQEEVTASFDNGILTVVVPKAKKHEARRIAIY